MRTTERIFLFLFLLFFQAGMMTHPEKTHAVEMDFSGQLSGQAGTATSDNDWNSEFNVTYIPTFGLSTVLGDDNLLDFEVSLKTSLNSFQAWETGLTTSNSASLDLYRLKLRLATARTETRVGLQKINFGPAKLLRSLRWFDQLDPTDPLNQTGGVWGARFRFDAENNTGLMLWALYGNTVKGSELLPTADETIEAGARFSWPFLNGETALTVHTREVEGLALMIPDFRENRIAIDGQWDLGQWDLGVGLWFELALIEKKSPFYLLPFTKMFTFGLDYTLENGIYILAEQMVIVNSANLQDLSNRVAISALSLGFLLNIMDSVNGMIFYDWDKDRTSLNLSWQRAYDSTTISISLFYVPDQAAALTGQGLAGYGAKLLMVYNH